MYKKGRWVKVRSDIKDSRGRVLTKGTVGITAGYRPVKVAGQPGEEDRIESVLELHLVTFPRGETAEVIFIPDRLVEPVTTKAELPADRVAHLPDNWRPKGFQGD